MRLYVLAHVASATVTIVREWGHKEAKNAEVSCASCALDRERAPSVSVIRDYCCIINHHGHVRTRNLSDSCSFPAILTHTSHERVLVHK